MYCPRCGQQQISAETKFCSRCGLPLALISKILANSGYLPELSESDKNTSIFTKRHGVFFSFLWFIFFVPFLTSVLGGILEIEGLALFSALIGVFGAIVFFVGSLVFLKSSKPRETITEFNSKFQTNPQIQGIPEQQALPPQQSMPVPDYIFSGIRRNSSDSVEIGSVTDETTRMLKDRETK